MNRDKGAHFLSSIYDPPLTSSTSTRMPQSGDCWREVESTKLFLMGSTLSEGVWNWNIKWTIWFWRMNLFYIGLQLLAKAYGKTRMFSISQIYRPIPHFTHCFCSFYLIKTPWLEQRFPRLGIHENKHPNFTTRHDNIRNLPHVH